VHVHVLVVLKKKPERGASHSGWLVGGHASQRVPREAEHQ
jgi:hypothetical protein